MKTIKRTIHLERLRSRMPSVVPAVMDNSGDVVMFTESAKCPSYFAFEALSEGTVTIKSTNSNLRRIIYYSIDYGENWTRFTTTTSARTIARLKVGDRLFIKGNNSSYATNENFISFGGTAKTKVFGNILSLVYGDNYEGKKELSGEHNFSKLFCGYSNLVDSSELILPIEVLTPYCFASMYSGCTSLSSIPSIQAKKVEDHSCFEMFAYCTSLEDGSIVLSAPELGAYCYDSMFEHCHKLTVPPILPVKDLEEYCYCDMFDSCYALTKAPYLPATEMKYCCYAWMFLNCSALNHIECMAVDISAENCLEHWVQNVATSGTFIKNSSATWNISGMNGVPTSWTVTYREPIEVNETQVVRQTCIYGKQVYKTLTNPTIEPYLRSNYNMFPSDIFLTNTPLSAIGDTASYVDIAEWYHFMEDYKSSLKVSIPCGLKVYSSATYHNSENVDYIDEDYDTIYEKLGGDEGYKWLQDNVFLKFDIPEKYVDTWHKENLFVNDFATWYGWFSECYKKYGEYTSVSSCTNDKQCCECARYFELGGKDMYDEMTTWLNSVSFNAEVVKTSSVTEDDTELFINNDGKYYSIRRSEYVQPQEVVKEINYSSYIELPISIVNETDDLGEMSVLASDWEALVNYKQQSLEYTQEEYSGGTVVIYNDKDWILTESGNSGYYYSNKFKEPYFGTVSGMTDEEALYFSFTKNSLQKDDYDIIGNPKVNWSRYIDAYSSTHQVEFMKNSADTYAYKYNTIKIDPTPLDMADVYEIQHSESGCVLVNDVLCEIFGAYYVYYGKYYIVNDYDIGNPYIFLRGKKRYAFYDEEEKEWYININGDSCRVDDNYIKVEFGAFIEYNDMLYPYYEGDDFVEINTLLTPILDTYEIFYDYIYRYGKVVPVNIQDNYIEKYEYKYFEKLVSGDTADDNDRMQHYLAKDDYLFMSKEPLSKKEVNDNSVNASKLKGYYIDTNNVYEIKPYKVYSTSYITGTTESKLNQFKSKLTSFDDMGNQLPGIYSPISADTSANFSQPQEGDILDLPFMVGTVKNIVQIEPKLDYGENDLCHIDTFSGSVNSFTPNNITVTITEVTDRTWDQIISETQQGNTASDNGQDEPTTTSEEGGENQWDTFDYMQHMDYTDYYWGDILSSMEFHIDDVYGRKIMSLLIDTNKFDFDGTRITYNMGFKNYFKGGEWIPLNENDIPKHKASEAIKYLIKEFEEYKNRDVDAFFIEHGNVYSSDIKCDFEYFNGAILTREYSSTTISGESVNIYGPFKVSFLDDGSNFDDIASMPLSERIGRNYDFSEAHNHYHHHFNYGVRYKETCSIKLREYPYALNDYYSYNILYYDVERPNAIAAYGDTPVLKNTADFTTDILSYIPYDGGMASLNINDDTFMDDGGFICVPTYREEYKLGIATRESKEGDIYINRGDGHSIMRHLDLMSCKSYDALANYGNGYFKIRET